jgi:hypothetical protein
MLGLLHGDMIWKNISEELLFATSLIRNLKQVLCHCQVATLGIYNRNCQLWLITLRHANMYMSRWLQETCNWLHDSSCLWYHIRIVTVYIIWALNEALRWCTWLRSGSTSRLAYRDSEMSWWVHRVHTTFNFELPIGIHKSEVTVKLQDSTTQLGNTPAGQTGVL